MSETLKAYVAGLLDGEAYIGAIRRAPERSHGVSPRYSIRVAVMMADEAPIRVIAGLAGAEASVYLRDRKQKQHHSPMWVIDLEADRAYALLRAVLPFLICKRAQAEFACELFELKRARARNGKAIEAELLARFDLLYLAMRRRPNGTNNGVGARVWR